MSAAENDEIFPDYVCLVKDPKDDEQPSLFTPDQLATLTSDANQLIGGLISPLSGNLYLQQNDFTVVGAQDIPVTRVYVAPYMPHLFNKHFDRDCYYRRCYLLRNYEGWKFFPHIRLWYDRGKNEVHLINPNGAAYDFSLSDGKTKLLHPYAVNNVGGQDIPCGRYDPRNTRISLEGNTLVISSPDGSVRYYNHKNGTIYLLEKEKLPHGKIFKYHYTDAGELSRVESLDPKEHHVYASLNVEGLPKEGASRFISSTGLNASYVYENRHVEGRFRAHKRTMRYSAVMPPLLRSVDSPQYKNEAVEYASVSLLIDSFSGKKEIFTLSRSPFGGGDRTHYRVDKLLFPVGPNDILVPVHEMSYEPATAGEQEGKTTVKNQNGTSTIYHFSKNLLTTSIQYIGQDGVLKKEKTFTWDDNNRLSSVEVRDGNKNLFLRKSYEYDSFGNPTLETLTGDLQGLGQEDHYSIKREFSQDGHNLILREETEEGKVTSFGYLPDTNLVSSKLTKDGDKLLIQESFEYDDCHNLVCKTISDGVGQQTITRYFLREQAPFLHMPEWVEEKYLEKGVKKLLKRTHLTYDQWGNIIEEKLFDANGDYAYSILKEYDEQGNLLSETNPLGQRRTYVYDEKGRCLEETSFSQNLTEKMGYDAKGRLRNYQTTGNDGSLHTASYEYDYHDNLTRKTDTYQNAISYEYDPLTQKVATTQFPSIATCENQTVTVSTSSIYDSLGREISKTNANGNSILYSYNAFGLPLEITYPNGSQEAYTYTKNGKIASHTNRDGLTIHFSYDVLERVVSKSYSNDLGKETFSYDSFHLLEETDLDGNTTRYSYDGAGRKIQEEKSGRITHYSYDGLGRLSMISQEGLRTCLKRDLKGRVLEENKADAQGNLLSKISYNYNEDGDLKTVTRYIDGKDAIESYSYDSFGREIAIKDPYGNTTTIVYDEDHTNHLGQKVLQITTTDPHDVAVIETKDPFLRVVKEETRSPKGIIIAGFEKYYDPNGNVTDWKEHVYEEGQYQNTQWTHYTYSDDNKITSMTRGFGTPESRKTYYTYTPSGKVETKTLPDGTILAYSYHPLGFLSSLTSTDGTIKHQFQCNKSGKLLAAHDAVEKTSIRREVDPFGNVVREIFPGNIEVKKSYDAFDRPTALRLSGVGSVIYTYDPLFLRKIDRFGTDGKLHYSHLYESYDLDENLLSERMIFDAGKITHRFDLKRRQAEVVSPCFSQKSKYDERGNLILNTIDNQPISYVYDDLSQLISEDDQAFGYDSVHNRIQKDDEHFQTNHLNELADQTYDLNGNQIQKGNVHYTYDPLNRLREATFGDKKVQFLYDPLGRRLTKIKFNKKSATWQEVDRENYLYDGQQEIGALSSDGVLKNFRVLGTQLHSEMPTTVAIELGTKTFAPLTDAEGNICRLIDPFSKKVVHRYEFTAFGEEKHNRIDNNPWRYAAKRFDPDLNIVYFGKRDYDPDLGRWLTTDPAGFVDSLNLYQYALNNPFSYYDPDGEFLFMACIPFAVLFTSTAVKICVDAIAVGIGCWGLYKSTQYAANAVGSPYTLSEGTCYTFVDNAFDNRWDYYTKMDKKKNREKNYPGSPKDLKKNPDWKETTHPEQAKGGSRVFENTKTGEKIRYDKGKPGANGHKANDHYHRYNPRSKGDHDRYLDKDGNPVHKNDDASNLYPPEGTSWD